MEKDELYEDAEKAVKEAGKATVSFLQRKFRIGYNRASHLMQALEESDVVSEPSYNGTREVL
jgi:DNA segregation ATPase FtsK/SpoIIIE-like protein